MSIAAREKAIIAIALIFSMPLAVSAGRRHGATIHPGSTVYIDTNNGFEIFILAAFQEKRVPLRIVSVRDGADYVLDSSLFHDAGFIATQKAAGTYRTSEAAFKLTSKAGDIVWAYAATKGALSRGGGKQSVAESCAKHIKELVLRER